MVQFKQNINTNWEEKSMKNIFSDSKERFSIRKYTIGVASVFVINTGICGRKCLCGRSEE